MSRIYAATAIAFIVALLGGLTVFIVMKKGAGLSGCSSSSVAQSADIGGPFELVDETGATVTDRDVITKPTLVYFGYTYCPDICPLDTTRNAQALDLLRERGVDVGSLFISVDPERDTPEVLTSFTDAMHPEMIGLTGRPEQVKAVADAYRVYFKKQADDPEYYLIDHTTFTYLVFPDRGFVEFFRRDVTPEDMADIVSCYVSQS